MKKCKACRIEKDLSEFPKNGRHRSGNVAYRPDCKDCHKAYKKVKYANDGHTATKQKAQKRRRYASDPKLRVLRAEKWLTWSRTENGRAISGSHRSARRARLMNAESPDNVIQLEKKFRLNMKECAKCGTTEDLSLDHIDPLINGGIHNVDNWQCLCLTCNSSKGGRV